MRADTGIKLSLTFKCSHHTCKLAVATLYSYSDNNIQMNRLPNMEVLRQEHLHVHV